ncbi:unnamed protein product [Lactuca virosa]|uniref:Pentatricopeptide repeat-containing protein n=1 Tax=Lactuca virosa TaxID=75947 RepID=A0AAU9LA13_9ASTR|nr:unnamed protein product [Lactuca virosa]
MITENMIPNHVTFLAVLSACSYSSLLDQGWDIFESMGTDFKVKPRAMHYACMIELLSREGLLDEAFSLIQNAPFNPTVNMWAALLTACRVHKNLELGKLAAEKIYVTVRTKRHGNLIDEEIFEGSSGSGGAENEGYQKGRKFYRQKDDNDLDDGGEACSGIGEGLAVGVGGKFDENIEHSSQGKRKKNKKLLFRDETSALDALQTLVDLSLMIQSSKGDDSPVLKDDKPATGTNDNNAPGRPGSTSNRRHKTKVSENRKEKTSQHLLRFSLKKKNLQINSYIPYSATPDEYSASSSTNHDLSQISHAMLKWVGSGSNLTQKA